MAAASLPIDDSLFMQGSFDFASGIACAEALLQRDDRPTAIFATNDPMALGVLTLAHDLGLRVPEDLSVAGFDDTPASRTSWPPLTTVRQPLDHMGRAAIDALINGPGEPPRFTFSLVARGSTGAAPR